MTVNFFKKKGILSITILLLKIALVNAQFDSLKWSNYYSNHSGSSRDNVIAVQILNKESLIMTCNTENDFTNFDVSTIKLDNKGNRLWVKDFSSIGQHDSEDFTKDMTIDSSGNTFVVVSSNYSPYYNTPTIIKYNNEGNLLWSKTIKDYNCVGFEAGFCDVETDNFGNCYFLAYACLAGNLQPKTFLMKFDNEGSWIWTKTSYLYNPKKIIINKTQDIFIINNNDEQQKKKTIIQKYSKNGSLLSEHRYDNYDIDLIDAKIDSRNNLWGFSNFSFAGLSDKRTCDILISKYDSMGLLINQNRYDSQYHDYDALKQVQTLSDSTFLLGMDSTSPVDGIDHQFIVIDKNLKIIDSLRLDGGRHTNDFLISFDQTYNKSLIVTGISYLDDINFIPVVYKLNKLKDIEWLKIPSISNKIRTYPKKIFVDKHGSIFLTGDVQSTVNPNLDFDTHAKIFVTKIDSSGKELSTNEFGKSGKSYIVGSRVKLDNSGNSYVSGFEQHGPIYEYVFNYYDQNLVLNKYNSNGESIWSRKIGPRGKYLEEYINHFISSDTLITVIASYGIDASTTVFYNFNSQGTLLDSATYNKSVLSAVSDNNGYFYLAFLNNSSFSIVKFDKNLKVVNETVVPTTYYREQYLEYIRNSLYFISSHTNDVYKFDINLNKIWHTNLDHYSDYTSSLSIDNLDNVFISATRKHGKLIKLKANGSVQWCTEVSEMVHSDSGVECLKSGDIVLLGSECSVMGCSPNGLALISKDGTLIKYVSTNCVIGKHLIDQDGAIYIFSNANQYQKYSQTLDLLVNDNFRKLNSFGYNLNINDVLINSKKEIIVAGSLGEWLGNALVAWYTLAIIKVDQVNSAPVFPIKITHIKLLPGEIFNLNISAKDYDNDTIKYNLLVKYNWLEMNEKSESLICSPQIQDTGFYYIPLIVSDYSNRADTNKIYIQVGNKPPYIISKADTIAYVNKKYTYKIIALDQDDSLIHFKLENAPSWIISDSIGILSGTPSKQDTGIYEVHVVCSDDYEGRTEQNFTLHVIDVKPTGINDFARVNDIKIYPNPSNTWITIESDNLFQKGVRIKIISNSGKIIKDISVNNTYAKSIKVDLTGTQPGLYFFFIEVNGKFLSKKIVVK